MLSCNSLKGCEINFACDWVACGSDNQVGEPEEGQVWKEKMVPF